MFECDITYETEMTENFINNEKIKEFTKFILKKEYKKIENAAEDFYLSILITDNEMIREINREYRNKNSVTDVISFAYNETENEGVVNILGDIVISMEKVREQAKEYGHSEKREFYYVLCHGMLHLLGYNHIEEEEEKVMREKEEEILKEFDCVR